MFKNIEEMQKFGKDQLDAVTETATNVSRGVQAIAVEATDYSRKSLETSTAMFEKLLGAKSLDSAIQIQSDYAKSAYEAFIAQATRFGELYTNLAKDAFRPVETAVAKAQSAAK
jgi:hypothetical protein